MSPQDIFRKLVKHSEMLCTLHHDDRHDRVVSSSFDAFLTQLDVQLQDSILAQIVKAVEVRVSSLEETLLDLLRKEREVSGHTAGRQESSPKSSAAIDLKSTLETHLRLASHFLVFTKACRCKVKGLLTGESEQDMSRKHVPLVPNTRDARLSLLLSESVKSRSASLVRFILTHVTRDDDDDNGDAYGGIGRAIWEEACALGDKDVVTALLEHASPLAGQWKPMETSSPPKKTNWSIVHCALSGFSAELHATQHLKTELTVSPGIRLGEDVLQCFLRGSSNFAGVCPNAKDNAGHIRRSIALTLISTSPYFYSPRRDEREDFEKYPYSVLDLCAGVGCWSGVEFILNHESNIFSISNTSACTPCLFMHHCMLNANEKALDVFMRQLIASRKSIDQVQYKTNLRQLGRMLSSKRLFPHPSTPHVMTAHYLIHDALLSKSETLIKKLLWITKSIMDQLRDDNAMDSYDRHMSFIDGLPHATSSHFDVIEGNLYHYAVLSGSRKVVKYLFEAGLPNSPHSESKLAFVPIRPVILRKRRSHELFQDLIEYCPDFLTPLQVAMRWGSTECLELILQVGPDMYSAEMSRRLLLEAICYCQLESSAACFTFHFLTERLFMRLLKSDNYHLENNKTNMFQLCIQTKYHQPKVSIANQFASDVSQHDSCLFPEKDLLSLQNYCFEVRWPSVCCLLIQCHFLDLLMNPSEREELLIDAHYQALYRRAIEHGCEEVAVAIFLFYQESAAAKVMHMTPPLLVLDDVMRSNGDMFYRLLNTAANSSVMSPHHGSDASPVKDESTSVSMFDVSSQPDDILIDLNNFRSLLLEAEHTNSGDALEGSLHHPPNNIIEAALSLSELKTPPEDEDSPNRAEHMADANKERSSRNGDSSSERDRDDSPVQSPGQGDLLVPGLGSTAKKRVVVIRTRDGRKATFYVNSKYNA